LPPVN